MSIPVNFNGKNIIEPGAYSQIKSGVPSKPPTLTSGNLVLIDTGSGAGYGSGSGINGVHINGQACFYGFDNSRDFQNFAKGGVFYDVADYIFNPTKSSEDRGPGMVYFVRACSTTPSSITILVPDGTLVIKTINEGVASNAVLSGSNLSKGYSAILRKSIYDTSKYVIDFYQGTFAGISPNGNFYNGISDVDSKPILIVSSKEFLSLDELINWINKDVTFSKLFTVFSSTGGQVNTPSLVLDTNILSVGGTETYDASALDSVIEYLDEIDCEFILTDKTNTDARSIENVKLFNFVNTNSGGENSKTLIIGGGNDELTFNSDLNSSVQVAQFYDNQKVILVHSGIKRLNIYTKKEEKLSSFYYAANLAGRLGGLEPQTPLTYKKLKVDNFIHNLKEKNRIQALQTGVIHNKIVSGMGSVVNQGINTLQKNTQLFNPDGTSDEISIVRIGTMLNKEAIRNLRPLFIGNNSGKATPEDVKLNVINFLRSKCVTDQKDNLIINFKNVTVILTEDYYDVQYGFYPNGPINKLFLTGFMLDYNAILK
jgi:hypothetical protein